MLRKKLAAWIVLVGARFPDFRDRVRGLPGVLDRLVRIDSRSGLLSVSQILCAVLRRRAIRSWKKTRHPRDLIRLKNSTSTYDVHRLISKVALGYFAFLARNASSRKGVPSRASLFVPKASRDGLVHSPSVINPSTGP